MLNGLLDLPWWGVVLYTLGLTHVTIVAVTVYLHRHQAHRALDLHPAIAHVFRFWLWLTTGMVTGEWVAVHRKHHARCETPEDPHSPQVEGLGTVLWRGAELYRRETANRAILGRYGKGTPDDVLEQHLYRRHPLLGVGLMLLLNLLLLGPIGLSVWAVQMIWIPFWAAGVINGVGHYFGYRNYDSPDASTNIVPWGILIGGEELHNNHHAYPGSARLSARRFEFDLGWFYIRLLAALRLASIRRVAPAPARLLAGGNPWLDSEAARAIAKRRLQVLARYGRDVVARVHREELRRVRGDRRLRRLFRRARRPLLREAAASAAGSRERLTAVLESSSTLRTVYEFRRRLREVCTHAAAGREETQLALQQWCREAEASRIHALEQFASRLGRYRLTEA